MKKYIIACLLALTAGMSIATAQNKSVPKEAEHKGLLWSALHGLEYEFKAGDNNGGTAPLPLPQEIRSIDSYKPGLAISIEGNVTKWIDKNKEWGVNLGVRLDTKSMTTEATVKNYGMEIINNIGRPTGGLWTGGVKTKVKMSLLTIPVLATYQINKRWRVSAGPYFSYLMDGDFSGNVYEGHLRTPDATGEMISFSGESIATYDFTDELRNFQWGLQVGGSWKAYRHLNVHADLTWGLNDIFNKEFKTITFAMYPIYLNIGFGYKF